jgi:aminoacyl tRNA synthase complex-interacting multifunctional protein 1
MSPYVPVVVRARKSSTIVRAADTSEDAAAAPATPEIPDVSKLDVRVGTILSAEDHPEADSLYVEQIDLGEEEGPRTIVSGLKKYVAIEDIVGKKVLVLANLKARNMRGIKSHGMLLCASNDDHSEVEPLAAPEDAVNGERVYFGDDQEQDEAALPNQLQKKKFWEACQPLLKTDASGVATFNGDRSMMTSAGVVKAFKLVNATIS